MTSTSLVGDSFFGIDLSQLSARLKRLRRHVSKRVLLLEFASEGLLIAETRFSGAGLQFDHLTYFPLPPEALDRGVPADPAKMGQLIQQICREKQISVHRAAVVLPSEVAFQHLINLPVGLSSEQARSYVLDPSNGLQIPIALRQADFDLLPTQLPLVQNESSPVSQSYLITAIPGNLVDCVMDTLQVAELELHALEVGSYSQLRLMISDLMALADQQLRLVLDLQTECTHFSLVGSLGALRFERLAAIRDFPDPELTDEQANIFLQDGGVAETLSVKKEGYLPISELDLRVLISEVRDALGRFSSDWDGFELVDIVLAGRNSAHPHISALLSDEFGCPVKAIEPILAHGLEGVQFESIVIQKSLNRLIGLGLGLLPLDHLLEASSSKSSYSLDVKGGLPLEHMISPVDSDQFRSSSIEFETQSTDMTSEESIVSSDLSASIVVDDNVLDQRNGDVYSGPHIDEDFQENLIDDSQSYLSNMYLSVPQDNSTETQPGVNLDQQGLADRPDEEWPTISSASEHVGDAVENAMSLQFDDKEDLWPSVVDLGDLQLDSDKVSANEIEQASREDVRLCNVSDQDQAPLESIGYENDSNAPIEKASESSLSHELVTENILKIDLDMPKGQDFSNTNPGDSLPESSGTNRVDESDKDNPNREKSDVEKSSNKTEHDVQSLIGELRLSDD